MEKDRMQKRHDRLRERFARGEQKRFSNTEWMHQSWEPADLTSYRTGGALRLVEPDGHVTLNDPDPLCDLLPPVDYTSNGKYLLRTGLNRHGRRKMQRLAVRVEQHHRRDELGRWLDVQREV